MISCFSKYLMRKRKASVTQAGGDWKYPILGDFGSTVPSNFLHNVVEGFLSGHCHCHCNGCIGGREILLSRAREPGPVLFTPFSNRASQGKSLNLYVPPSSLHKVGIVMLTFPTEVL